MKIRIPDINDNESFIEGKQSIVLLGANGAGKTRMSVWIDENNPELNVHRISAQKSLDISGNFTDNAQTIIQNIISDRYKFTNTIFLSKKELENHNIMIEK